MSYIQVYQKAHEKHIHEKTKYEFKKFFALEYAFFLFSTKSLKYSCSVSVYINISHTHNVHTVFSMLGTFLTTL